MPQDVNQDGGHVFQLAARLQLEGCQEQAGCRLMQQTLEQLCPSRSPKTGWKLWRTPHCLYRLPVITACVGIKAMKPLWTNHESCARASQDLIQNERPADSGR